MLLLLSEINKINMNYFDFRFDRARSKLCTKPGALSGNYELRVCNYELLSYNHVYMFRRMGIRHLYFVFILNLCYCLPSTLALIQPMPWYDKIPNLDDYDMSVIYYNTVTLSCLCHIRYVAG